MRKDWEALQEQIDELFRIVHGLAEVVTKREKEEIEYKISNGKSEIESVGDRVGDLSWKMSVMQRELDALKEVKKGGKK